MARTSYTGYIRQYGAGKKNGTPVVLQAVAQASFDATSATQIELFTLPKGAIPLQVTSLGGATGGTNPTVDIGTAVDGDGFATELDSDDVVFGDSGALTGIELAVDTIVFGEVGASAATGGTVKILMNYIMADDGSA